MLASSRVVLAVTVTSLFASVASAQGEGGVSGSGLADGGAHITTRADVSLSLESAPGTGAARVAAWGSAMSPTMTAIRECYNRVVAERETVQGSMRIRVTLPERGAITLEVGEDTTNDAALLRCVRTALIATPTETLHRPSGVFAVLQFSNTASSSAVASAAAASEADAVSVSREGGTPSASGEAREGLVRWVVRGAADVSDELIAEGFRVMRSQIPGLLDCRRRASRRERDPSGSLVLSLRLRSGARASATVRSTTVADTTVGRCVTQRVGRAPHRPSETGTVEVEITFLP